MSLMNEVSKVRKVVVKAGEEVVDAGYVGGTFTIHDGDEFYGVRGDGYVDAESIAGILVDHAGDDYGVYAGDGYVDAESIAGILVDHAGDVYAGVAADTAADDFDFGDAVNILSTILDDFVDGVDNEVPINDGTGTFMLGAPLPSGPFNSWDVALGDLDGKGDYPAVGEPGPPDNIPDGLFPDFII